MIETFLPLLDKVVKFLETREIKRRRLLDDYARPVLKEMEKIHMEYRNSVSNARQLLKEGASPANVLEIIQKEKWLLKPLRDRVTASIRAIVARGSSLDETGVDFFFSLERYFCVLGSTSVYSFVVRELETERPSDHLMSLVVNWLDDQWRNVCESFAEFEASLA